MVIPSRGTVEAKMKPNGEIVYDDGGIVCDDQRLRINRYYPWGRKQIPYAAIKGVTVLPLTGANRVRRWRIWGSGDFVHWWNLDTHRPNKEVALVIDVGRRIRPTITPDDPTTVERILVEHLSK
jgi:hypothetical protein